MSRASITAIVLAAGEGRRMGSTLPKSLHPVAGKPMLARILQSLRQAELNQIRVVIDEQYDRLMRPVVEAFKATVFFQEKLKGTASAAKSVQLESCSDAVLIVNGDHPLIDPLDLKKIVKQFYAESADMCIGSFETQNPDEYGRIIRRKDQVMAIVEKESLTHESESSREINTGIYLVKNEHLQDYLSQMTYSDLKKEYMLTDIVSVLASGGKKVIAVAMSEDTALGVNSQKTLAFATKKVFTRKLHQLMKQGVIIVDPFNSYIEEDVQIGQGSIIYPSVYLKGRTGIGPFCAIEANCFIVDSVIHNSVLVRAGSYLESTEVGAQSVIGPYARLRPGTKIGTQCKVGNFVEMKKTNFGARSKAGHFSYLGDAEVGEDVNIGCGVVTSNLNIDGKKYSTKIGNQTFVGSGTQLVAPVELGTHSATGAGSVITKNVSAETLAVERSSQKNYLRKNRKENKSDES